VEPPGPSGVRQETSDSALPTILTVAAPNRSDRVWTSGSPSRGPVLGGPSSLRRSPPTRLSAGSCVRCRKVDGRLEWIGVCDPPCWRTVGSRPKACGRCRRSRHANDPEDTGERLGESRSSRTSYRRGLRALRSRLTVEALGARTLRPSPARRSTNSRCTSGRQTGGALQTLPVPCSERLRT
jgi:hypothetical protein